MENYKCTLCGESNWKVVDEFRYKPAGMAVCLSCGFVTYPERCAKVDKVHQHYEHEYRGAPTVNNLFTSERKLHYHVCFLDDLFQEWGKAGKQPTILEIGAALGLFLHWSRQQWPKGIFHGTELTRAFVNVAREMYGIKLDADFDDTKQYDLIMSYKVAEHMPDVLDQLARYRKALTPDGRLYISVPTWFGRLNDFGSSGFNIENYFDPNHVNVWSRKQFEHLLVRAGFEIVKENHLYYDDTYLCKAGAYVTEVYKEDPAVRLDQLRRIHEVAIALDQSRFQDAIAAWPNCPVAHIGYYEQNRSRAHAEGIDAIWETYLKPAREACGETHYILSHLVDILMRYDQNQRALEICKVWLENHPMDGTALMNMAQCLRVEAMRAANPEEKSRLLRECIKLLKLIKQTSMERSNEAITWSFQDAALLNQ
jgi:SAM-dependent methyltransferase